MATHESIDRLSYETRHLADVVAQSAGLWRDQASEHIHRRYLRPHASAAAGILEGLAEQDEHDSATSNHAEEAYGYQEQAFAVVEVVNAEVDRAKRHEQSAHSFLDQTLRHEQIVGQIEAEFRSLIDQANHSCNGCPGHAGQVAPTVVLPGRVDQLASVPTPQSSASAEADFALATGRNYGAAAEFTVGGRKFVEHQTRLAPQRVPYILPCRKYWTECPKVGSLIHMENVPRSGLLATRCTRVLSPAAERFVRFRLATVGSLNTGTPKTIAHLAAGSARNLELRTPDVC